MEENNEKKGWEAVLEGLGRCGSRVSKLLEVKSLVTLAMTAGLLGLLFTEREVGKDMLMLFSTSYGAVITYFFTRKDSGGGAAGGQ